MISCKGQVMKKEKYDMAYKRDRDVYLLNLTDKKEFCIKDGSDPAISPDGLKVAYTKSTKPGTDLIRYIMLVDLDTKSETKLNIKNNNYYGASWSPDNNFIAFEILIDDIWKVGFIKSNNSELRIITPNSGIGLFSPTWSSDSKYIYAHNLTKLFKYDLNCNLIDSIDIQKTFSENYYISGGTKFLFTSDNNYIIFNCGNNGTDKEMKNDEGQVEAIYVYNIKTKEIDRLSPIGMLVGYLANESDTSVLFSGFSENEKTDNIYRINLLTKHLELIIKDGNNPTIRKK